MVATAIAALPFRDIRSGQRVVEALFGGELDCTDGIKPSNPAYPVDAIVVLGAGSSRDADGQALPSYLGTIRWDAAARLYARGAAPFIIVANGEDAAIEIKYLQSAYRAVTGDDAPIPEKAILVSSPATNTATEAAGVAAIAEDHGIQLVLVDTNYFHRRRATALFCANGVPASSVAAEKVILEDSPERAGEFEVLYDSSDMELYEAEEKGKLALLVFDPTGFVPTMIRGIMPP